MAYYTHPEYVKELFEFQTEMGLRNLRLLKEAIGDRIQIIWVSGNDMGSQRGLNFSPDIYREFYKKHHTRINNWIHENTKWKVAFHSCGSIVGLLDEFVEVGVDVINPVQTSAEGMDPRSLKEKYGKKLVFWGGGVDTQSVLPFKSPEAVREDVLKRLEIFTPGGGFVFATIHNIQHDVPIANVMALYAAIRDFNKMKAAKASDVSRSGGPFNTSR
jgi:uroporphyrinogen-III decarboxylase